MILFKVTHKHKLDNHWERKSIGTYSTRENACAAIENLKTQPGFCDTQNGFRIKKVFGITKPKLLDKTFWVEGFDTYTYYPGLGANEQRALELVRKYGFDFENIPKQEIVQLLEKEIENPWPGSAEYIRVLCGYLFCLGDAADLPLLEKAKYSVSMDVGCMIDAEWIDSLKYGGEPSETNGLPSRTRLIEDFMHYYKDWTKKS